MPTRGLRLPVTARWLMVLVLAAGAACSRKPPAETVQTPEAVDVVVVAARLDTLRNTVACTGTVTPSPAGDWTITAPEHGTIVDLPKSEGEAVKVGDLLVRFEIPGLTSELSARNADVTQATTRVNTAKARAASLAGLAERGIAARKDVLDAQSAQTEAEEALKQALAAQKTAATLGDRANVTARFDGIVAKRWHNVGDQVEGATTDPVLRVVDPSRAEIVALVPVGDLSRVFVGRPAAITNPATGAIEQGAVMTMPATVAGNSATFDARLRFLAPTTMAIGTEVSVEIISDERTDALVIPAVAILRDGTDVYVMVAGADGKAHKHAVSLGLVTPALVQVTTGLAAGDQVIVHGHDGLADGALIAVGR
jgi:RND family efflux transporter MFP subunit